ncbi:hypothetical protein BGW36DRAFT_454109 [Talaromyces proteolyticus]|uniref:Uncharacterized protein n=1 Tax=Talaromyces proteolyticus TaxID=1131652 RepID=A0AAD4KKW9_9EURO|nr:uncharacterized protein BGW36DRAFT_454109 [Talaromyces proteolyticus]KAH8693694.1 hypothetical protein BGW36DRAFT_454109 [Talaromyces proteolyticus]
MAFHFQDRRRSYLEPIEPLLYAVWALRVCLINALRSGDYGILVQYKRLRDLAFVLWFQTLNEHFLRFESRTTIPDLVAAAHGTVLDLGPGLGNQLTRFDQHRVEYIFGIEPNAAFRPALQTQIAKSNWTDRYTLITAGEGFGSIQGDEKPWSMLPRVWGELVKPARS